MEGGLDGGCRPRRGSRKGRRVLEGRMDRGADNKRGIVRRTRGGEDNWIGGTTVGRRERCGEGGRGAQWVMM